MIEDTFNMGEDCCCNETASSIVHGFLDLEATLSMDANLTETNELNCQQNQKWEANMGFKSQEEVLHKVSGSPDMVRDLN